MRKVCKCVEQEILCCDDTQAGHFMLYEPAGVQ
jgi:hypothetical protein